MPSLNLNNRLIWFAHCPKAGGTSVEAAMVARWGAKVEHLHWGWDLWWRRGGWRAADPPNSPQHLIWEDALSALARPPDVVFALVRDPVVRMVSEYRWQRHGRRGTRLGRALAYLPFSVWLALMLAMARRNPYAFDNHLRPQADFVPVNAQVFRLEDGMAPVLDWLATIADTDLGQNEPPHRLHRPGKPVRVGDGAKGRIAAAFAADYTRFEYHSAGPKRPGFWPADWVAERCAAGLVWLERHGML